MSAIDILPLLIVVILLITAGGTETMTVYFDGEHAIEGIDGAVVVGGGNATVPANASVTGSLYVIGGHTRVAGEIDGDVVVFGGDLTVTDSARITDELRLIGGDWTIAADATVTRRTVVKLTRTEPSLLSRITTLLGRTLLLALLAGLLARKRVFLLRNVADSVRNHLVVSAAVGTLVGVTTLSVIVFMAFTLILLPVSILGLVAGVVTFVYSLLAYGYLFGQWTTDALVRVRGLDGVVRRLEDSPGLTAAVGVVAFSVVLESLRLIPLVGDLIQIVVFVAGFGAVVITYFGLREFEPVSLPD